jgi:DNA-directed RNA polymerase specialized sigma24 family protein
MVCPNFRPGFRSTFLKDSHRATELLVRMTAVDLSPQSVSPPLWRVGWSLTWLGIGLETGDEERIDFSLDTLLGTSGRGWLYNRMKALGLDRADLHHELQILCTEMIYKFAERRAWIDDAAKAAGYVRNAFRNRMESRLDELADERKAHLSENFIEEDAATAIAFAAAADETPRREEVDERLKLTMMMDAANCSEREKEALTLRFEQDLEGESLAAALGVKVKTADELLRRARGEIR